ncbi:MAG TPA: DnaJ domain-containing protein [Marmoricola sp.]|jgi:Mce-associated membrane protein
MTTTPSWYDILGVRRDASPAEIKAAWREATDKFEPGSGSAHFRLFNEAADVLLDPARRSAYDAELAADAAGPKVDTRRDERGQALPPTHQDTRGERRRRLPSPRLDRSRDRGQEAGREATGRPVRQEAPRWLRLVVLVVLPLLTLASLAAAGYYAYHAHRDGLIEDARAEAPATAERALESALAYDYRHLGADEKRAARYFTARYKQKNHFAATYRLLAHGSNGRPSPAVSTKTVVTAHSVASSVVDAAPDLARVLVFVNQTSDKAGKQPVIFQNRVVVTLVRSGNGWLIDDLKSY